MQPHAAAHQGDGPGAEALDEGIGEAGKLAPRFPPDPKGGLFVRPPRLAPGGGAPPG